MSDESNDEKSVKAPKDIIGLLDYYFVKKAPFQLPKGVKEWIVKYGPWIDLVLLVLFLPAILFALGLSAMFIPFAAVGTGFGLAAIVLFVQVVLMVMALPGLFARKMSGWKFLFYSSVINIVYGLVNMFTVGFGSIVSTILGAVISFYVLFQVRSLYKK
jgi:hypothetical protein